MNILINKSLPQQMIHIMFDCYPSEDDTQTMLIYNEYSKQVYSILLGTNYSQSKYRGGKYLIETPQLEGIVEGNYIFKIVNTGGLDCSGCPPLSVGTLKVYIDCSDEDLQDDMPVIYNPTSEDEGYVVYREEYK